MKIAKTIDQLYEEVKSFDYVITCDAALATALNTRIDQCRIGGFAYTPKTIAGIVESIVLRGDSLSGLETVEEIEKQTGYDFKYIHGEIANIKDIRKYTADVKAYLPFRRSREIFDIYDTLPTQTKVMSIFEPSIYRTFMTGKKIAAIGVDLFDDLDKHFLPNDYEDIDPFLENGESFTIKTINAIGNDRQIAGSVVDLITDENCNETAIVMDTGGAISDAVRAALYRKKIPFKNDLDVKDLAQVRDFIQFLDLALDYRTVRVGDVRELISAYQTKRKNEHGEELRPEWDKYLLYKAPFKQDIEPFTANLLDTMKNITELSFEYVAEVLFEKLPQKTSVLMVLKSLKLSNEKITPKLVNRLSYAVNNVDELKHNDQVPEYEKKGVLLVDCKNSVYIDRGFVIFIGLDESWEVTAHGKDYVDKMDLDEQNMIRLSILLQQGSARIYAVKPVTNGKETIPCPTFQTIYSRGREVKEIKTFSDICTEYVHGSWFGQRPSQKMDIGGELLEIEKEDWSFSKTSYNAYSDCPIKFMFSKLVSSEDNEYSVFGNCIHDFAEFYFCYPERVNEKGLDHYVDELEKVYAGMSNKCEKDLDISKIRTYLKNVIRYVDRIRPANVSLTRPLPEKYPNPFMVAESLEYTSHFTENKMGKDGEPVFAKFDVCFDSFIADYKSGKSKTAKDIVAGFTWRGKKNSEFQALIYLYTLGNNTSARPCTFNLFFVGENDIASTEEDYDIMKNVRTVKYCSETLAELLFAPNGLVYKEIRDKSTYESFAVNWVAISRVLMEYSQYSNYDSESCYEEIREIIKSKKVTKAIREFVRKKVLNNLENPFPINEGIVYVPSDNMDKFIKNVRENRDSAEMERSLPIYSLDKGLIKCKNCDYYRMCLKAEVDNGDQEEEDEE